MRFIYDRVQKHRLIRVLLRKLTPMRAKGNAIINFEIRRLSIFVTSIMGRPGLRAIYVHIPNNAMRRLYDIQLRPIIQIRGRSVFSPNDVRAHVTNDNCATIKLIGGTGPHVLNDDLYTRHNTTILKTVISRSNLRINRDLHPR